MSAVTVRDVDVLIETVKRLEGELYRRKSCDGCLAEWKRLRNKYKAVANDKSNPGELRSYAFLWLDQNP